MPNGQDATTVARRNLIRIANDGKYLGATNVGYCHWFAVVRQALCNPDFIQGLVNFKKKYWNPSTNEINYDFNLLRIMKQVDYNGAIDAYYCLEQRLKMFLSITDDNGNLKENKYDSFGREIFPQTTQIIKNHLIPSIGGVGYDTPGIEQCQIDEVQKILCSDGKEAETPSTLCGSLNQNYIACRPKIIGTLLKGLPIHVCASPGHHYNVFMYNNKFIVTGCGDLQVYNRLSEAIFSYGQGKLKYSAFTIPERTPIPGPGYNGINTYDIPKEVFAYKKFGYIPWVHGRIKIGENLLPPEKTMLLDNYIKCIKQANYNKQIAWNNFLNYQKFNNQQMMHVCYNNWNYNNNFGIMAFNNACKVVNNNPILMAYYNQKMKGMIK